MSVIVVTGSEGVIGPKIVEFLKSINHEVICLDKQLGHDLTNRQFVENFFKKQFCRCAFKFICAQSSRWWSKI